MGLMCAKENVTTFDRNSPVGESALAEFQIGSYEPIVRGNLGILGLFLSR